MIPVFFNFEFLNIVLFYLAKYSSQLVTSVFLNGFIEHDQGFHMFHILPLSQLRIQLSDLLQLHDVLNQHRLILAAPIICYVVH